MGERWLVGLWLMAFAAQSLSSLLRTAEVDPTVYSNPEIFALELDRIFDRAWLLVGHESLIPKSGDFFLQRAGRHPLIVWRGLDGEIKAYLNRCAHRGARLCSRPRGNAKSVTCPYHGWVFDAAGDLKSLPAPKEYESTFDFNEWGLQSVAAIEQYRGFIFVRHTQEGPDLRTFLGELSSSIDDLVDRAPEGEVEICPVPLRHRFRGNWKLHLENLNDAHHARVAHRASVRAASQILRRARDGRNLAALQIMKSNGLPIESWGKLQLVTSAFGHSYIEGFIDRQNADSGLPFEYVQAMKDHYGEKETKRILSVDRHNTLLYPSGSVQGRFQVMRLIQPLAPNLTEIVGYMFRLKGAPDVMFQEAREYFQITMSPFSIIATDDFYLYEGAQEANSSTLAAPMPIMRGMNGAAKTTGCDIHKATSEAFIRNQYATWENYMCEVGISQ